ncbi:beta-ketoacyl-[acyl-carrier-protein] synthase family protein [Halodesulfovibrio aestuarii]|uniref:beta-ketoacyl-[acyl-carrier-protein] synthase family protein n=1 Tax=Halodesulfovibrio aestuarii TaxID=126333 RepID=UPI003D350869
MTSVFITGTGCITGSGSTPQSTLAAMYEGTADPSPFVRHRMDWGKEALVFAVDDALLEKASGRTEQYGLTARLGLGAAFQALEDAGISPADLKGKRVGVVMGTTVGCSMNHIVFYGEYRDPDIALPSMEHIRCVLRSNPAEAIARELAVVGPAQTVVTACASGTDAIGVGLQWIQSGMCDMVIAGGCDGLSRVTLNGFHSLMVMDSERSKPFDVDRKGLTLGEGSGVLVLESEQSVTQRKVTPKARLAGYATACDAYHLTAPHPQGRGLIRAMKQLFAHIECTPADISFVNVHGTGTKDNDNVEGYVMHELLPHVPFFSSKGATGHTLGAAGGIEAALCVHCLNQGRIPPTTGLTTPDPAIPASPVLEATNVTGTIALSTSLAFGGIASVLAVSHI